MSKFLTPPVWYDKTGNKIDILNNETYAATGPDNTAIGTSAIAGSEGVSYGAVAVGCQAHAIGPNSIAIGSYDRTNGGSPRNVEALASGSIAIGGGAKANADSTDGIAIGRGSTSSQSGIAIGAASSATADGTVAFGLSAKAGIAKSLAIGHSAKTEGVGEGLIAIGYQSIAGDSNTIAIGSGAQAKASGSIAIGAGATANEAPNTIQLGNNNTAYTLKIGNNTIDPDLVQKFFAGDMVSGISGNLYVYSNVYKSGEAGSPSTGWYQASIDSVEKTVVVRDANGKIKAADPTAASDVATKQYVDKAIADTKKYVDDAIAALGL